MLLQFYFSNHKSFRNGTTLDMRADRSSELASHVRLAGNDKVLPVAAIYGSNASGKSNAFSAFDFMRDYIILSFYQGEEDSDKIDFNLKRKPHVMSKNINKPSEFETYFIKSDKKIDRYLNYGFSLDSRGVCEEWLRSNSKTGIIRNSDYKVIFHRKRGEETYYNSRLMKYKKNLEISLDNKTLLVSLGAKLKVKELVEVRNWFIKNDVFDCSSIVFDAVYSRKIPQNVVDNNDAKNKLLDFMRSFDDSIIDFIFEKKQKEDGEKHDKYRIYSIHSSNDNKDTVKLSFDDESSGTQKMFSLYQHLNNVLESGNVLFVDELDIKLHPLLMRNIILSFTDPSKNPNHAQLIFTTHNTVYMEMDLLRRDEIWFTEKQNNVSELYSLGDFIDLNGSKVRKDSNYEKNYLIGRYGAVPNLKPLLGGQHSEQKNQQAK